MCGNEINQNVNIRLITKDWKLKHHLYLGVELTDNMKYNHHNYRHHNTITSKASRVLRFVKL